MSSSQFKLEGASAGASIRGKPLSYNPQKRPAPVQQLLMQQQPQQQQPQLQPQQQLVRAPAKGTVISLPLPQQSITNDSFNATRRSTTTSQSTTPSTMRRGILALGKGAEDSAKRGVLRSMNDHELLLNSGSAIPRTDLTLLSEDVPLDGIIFARSRMNPSTLIVFRTPEERSRNPERLNLDRRQLDVCPFLESETRLRLLNFQNNNITVIQNLENLPNLIFLDLYNNKITSLEGPLSSLKTLRVLMAGKNKITEISNLSNLKKLDVLDLHSNNITEINGFETLQDLRVLNLAGNSISAVRNLHVLHSLTELNLRRNNIKLVEGLDTIPTLQRIFLSHNNISVLDRISCIFNSKFLLELTLDGNPISDDGNSMYRVEIITRMPNLKHLDLKRITDEERLCAKSALTTFNLEFSAPAGCAYDTAPTEVSALAETVERPPRPQISNSYYALARLGRLNPSSSVFEIEVSIA
jgi:Leucine-rich repeat (LRR) protein